MPQPCWVNLEHAFFPQETILTFVSMYIITIQITVCILCLWFLWLHAHLVTHIIYQLNPLEEFLTNELMVELTKETEEEDLHELVQHIDGDIARLCVSINQYYW